MLLFCSVQANACVVQSVAWSVSLLVSHCPLHVDYYIIQQSLQYYYSSLGNISIETFTYLLDSEPLNCVTKHSYLGVLLI